MNKQLYNKLIENISYAIKNSLNEMTKHIEHRTIDRKLWLSMASVCSRNKNTECEFIKPMKKLSKTELLDRYVAGLLIMRKPCPTSVNEIETLKSFKLLAQRAIALGATIDDIIDLYNINSGKVAAVKPAIVNNIKAAVKTDSTAVQRSEQDSSAAILKKYNMLVEPGNYFKWLKINIYRILDNNQKVRVYYTDYGRYGGANGIVEDFSKYGSNYYAGIVAYSGSTDSSETVSLSSLLADEDEYYYRRVDTREMSYVNDPDDAIYRCSIQDMEKLAKTTFGKVKELIMQGKIQ